MELNRRGEMMCVWSGAVAMLIFFVGWIACIGWLIPPDPSLGAAEIAEIYRNNSLLMRVGVALIANFAAPLTVAFGAIITIYMLKMKGPSPVLAWINIAACAITVLIFVIPVEIVAVGAYREERADELILFGNDLAWFIFDNVVGPTQLQWLAIALAVFWDRSEQPVMPRWFGYFCLWSATILLCNNLILFFKDGPFAWNGILGWWPGAIIFCTWYFVACYVMYHAVKKQHSPRKI